MERVNKIGGKYVLLLEEVGSFLLLALMVESCQRYSASFDCPNDTTMRTYKQWRESIRFPYTASPIRKERIVKNFGRVGVGSTKEELVEALGQPDFEEETYPKEPNRPCKGYLLKYYFEKRDADLVNEIRDNE